MSTTFILLALPDETVAFLSFGLVRPCTLPSASFSCGAELGFSLPFLLFEAFERADLLEPTALGTSALASLP